MFAALLLCAAAQVVDGDTIRCSAVGRVRMVAIDAPDKPTSSVCRRHIGDHVCNESSAAITAAALKRYVEGKRVTYRVTGYDARNRRVVAQMFAGRTDLQCYMLANRWARYQVRYDRQAGYPILHRCRATVAKAWR